jgi:transcription elongation factor Elf1
MLTERHFPCPYCGERISMLLDLSTGNQQYVEDCEVCCRPIEIRYATEDGEEVAFGAYTMDE